MRSGSGVSCVEKVPLVFLLAFRGETRIHTDGCSFGGCRPPSRLLRKRSRTPVSWSPLLLSLMSRLCSSWLFFAYFTKTFMSEMATTSRPRDSICSFSWGAILPAHTHTITHSCHYTTTEQQQKTTQTKQEHRQNNNTGKITTHTYCPTIFWLNFAYSGNGTRQRAFASCLFACTPALKKVAHGSLWRGGTRVPKKH